MDLRDIMPASPEMNRADALADEDERCTCGHDGVMHGVNAFGGYCRECDACAGFESAE